MATSQAAPCKPRNRTQVSIATKCIRLRLGPPRSFRPFPNRSLGGLSRAARDLVSMVGLFLLGWTSYGMLQLKTTTKFDTMFSTKSKTIEDMTWIERNIGPLASMEILVEFDRANGMTALDRSMWLASLEEAVRTKPEVGGVLSPLTFLPSLPNGGSMRSVARRAILNQRLAEAIPELISHQLIHRSDQTETWRMVAKYLRFRSRTTASCRINCSPPSIR